MGGDADSVGSVTGQIAGSMYGVGGSKGMPLEWYDAIVVWDPPRNIALRFHKLFHHELVGDQAEE